MPPRKSNASAVDGAEEVPTMPRDALSVEDLSLPRTMVQRLARGVLPANMVIQKDALLAMSKSATVFVNYLASHANTNAANSHKKTIQPKDVLEAIKELELEQFLPRLEIELQKFTSIQSDKRHSYRRKVREGKAAVSGKDDTANEGGDDTMLTVDSETAAAGSSKTNGQGHAKDDGDEPPAAKRARRSHGGGATSADEPEDDDADMDEGADEGEEEEDAEEEEEEEEEEEGEGEEEDGAEGEHLREDPLETREEDEEEGEGSEGEESD